MKVMTMSTHRKPKYHKKNKASQFPSVAPQTTASDTPALNPAIKQASSLIQKKEYARAANLLAAAGYEPQVRMTLGVCLMRIGCVDRAVDLFRSLVLMPGTVQERSDVSNAAKRNFATALLMKGLPSGALSVLTETHNLDHPMAVRLNSAIKQWEKSLSWFRWLDWKLNGIEPANCKVLIDFEPGEFDFEVLAKRPVDPDKPDQAVLKLAV
jgi:hypothetical protein